MAKVKIRILRGITGPVERGIDANLAPTFAPGDIVEVERPLAQELVGNDKAEYVSGTLIEPAPYEEQPEEEEEKVTTASLEPSEENAMQERPRGRRRG